MSQLEFWFVILICSIWLFSLLALLNKIQQRAVALEGVKWNRTGSHETTENTYHWHLSLLLWYFPCKLHLSFFLSRNVRKPTKSRQLFLDYNLIEYQYNLFILPYQNYVGN